MSTRDRTESVDLNTQRRLLRSLGFGFLEEPAPLPAQTSPAPSPPPQRKPAPKKPPAAPRRPSAPAQAPLDAATALSPAEKQSRLSELATRIAACTNCGLNLTRTKAVPGHGTAQARVLFVGEAPGREDDSSGHPFDGEIGAMLQDIIKAMKLQPEDVFLTLAVKCHPIGGRPAREPEIDCCAPLLKEQIEFLRPELIVCFGIAGVQALLPEETRSGLQAIRGKWLDYRGIPLLSTFALPYIFSNKPRKRIVWEDLQGVMARLKP